MFDPRRRPLVATIGGLAALLLVIPWAMAASPSAETPVATTTAPLAEPAGPCLGRFVARELDHITTVPGDTVDQFETNGAGVAIGDLDDDGDLDVVLGNHAGPNTILWNLGNLVFQAERMPHGETRAVNLVDVDGDSRLDMVFTRRTGAVTYWRNTGAAENRFVQQTLPGVSRPAYAMLWADLDRDGDLDFVAGSYDAGLLSDLGNSFLLSANGGVTIYENREGRFAGQSLANSAQAMAIALFDADRDGRADIVVGNDFAVPDYLWLQTDDGWQRASFDATSHSTMSLDVGDVDNDGVAELFSSDMLPYAEDAATVAAWDPIMAAMTESYEPGDPQVMSNVLQVWTGANGYQNAAAGRGVDATGWTWSSKFGDLDQDGLLDLYTVNGFAEKTLFAHLPNHELVEENQALRNVGGGFFRPAPGWELGSTHGGRGMSLADLDGDGDLDIVVNNLRGPAQLFENRLCGGAALLVDLRWPGSGNSHALGSQVTLRTRAGSFTRDVRSASGYLSGDPPQLHFGVPAEALLTDAALAAALSAFQRSQVFVDTPWRAYVQGDDDAIDATARRGAALFFRPVEQGGAGCAACHSGDFFTNEQFYTLAVPQVGPGKHDGRNKDDDYGRFRESGRPEDLYAFRTPTLLNVAVTGPYGHDGAYATLEGIVRHHIQPAAAVAAYDPAQLGPAVRTTHWAENTQRALTKLAEDRLAGRTPLQDVALSEGQVADLVSFLHVLTDPCVLDPACLAPWIPGEGDGDPDGLRVKEPEIPQRMGNSEWSLEP